MAGLAVNQCQPCPNPINLNFFGAGYAHSEGDIFFDPVLEIEDADRRVLRDYIAADDATHYIVTHGTDTMPETAEVLSELEGKTIVLTGALTPARFRTTDAMFNVGMAVAAVQTLEPGVYIAMSGQVFKAGEVRKSRKENRFEPIDRS